MSERKEWLERAEFCDSGQWFHVYGTTNLKRLVVYRSETDRWQEIRQPENDFSGLNTIKETREELMKEKQEAERKAKVVQQVADKIAAQAKK